MTKTESWQVSQQRRLFHGTQALPHVVCRSTPRSEKVIDVLKFLASTAGVIFLIGLIVVIGLLMLIF